MRPFEQYVISHSLSFCSDAVWFKKKREREVVVSYSTSLTQIFRVWHGDEPTISDALSKTVRWMFLHQRPGDAAVFFSWLALSPDAFFFFFASWQLHLWMIHLTNRPVFKCICSEEAVVFQAGTLWAADIFTGRKSRLCKKRGSWRSLNHLAETDASGDSATF